MEKENKFLKFFSSIKYELTIFIFLIIEYLLKCPDGSISDGCLSTTYILSYQDFGFHSRMLLGSILRLFTDYITKKQLFTFIVTGIIFLCLLVSLVVGGLIRQSNGTDKKIIIYASVLFLASPFSISYLFHSSIYLDTYMIIIAIFSVIFVKNKYTVWLVPVLTVIAMLIHQSYVAFFMPVVGITFLDNIFNKKRKITTVFLLIVSCIISLGLFYKFQFMKTPLPFKDVDSTMAFLQTKTEITLGRAMLFYEYFATMKEHFAYSNVHFVSSVIKELVTFIELSPVIIIFISLWINAIKASQEKYKKIIFFLCLISPLCASPLFALATDWGRWTAMVFITQFILAFYFYRNRDKALYQSSEKIFLFFKKHQLLYYLTVFWMLFLSIHNSSFGFIGRKFVLY